MKCEDALLSCFKDEKFDVLFADPPDNIDLGYDQYEDNLSDDRYEQLMRLWILVFLEKATTVWLSFNARHTIMMGHLIYELQRKRKFLAKPCVQTFTFGQHRTTDFGNNHRPLWRLAQDGSMFYPDAIRIESERQRLGDKRANPLGRVPGDVFDFSRVVGNAKQRRSWHPTQLHEGLVERAILSSCPPGGSVCDPFGGTGTTLRVCKQLGLPCTLIEYSREYCERIAEENFLKSFDKANSMWYD